MSYVNKSVQKKMQKRWLQDSLFTQMIWLQKIV